MTRIALFVAEPTGTCRLALRRFTWLDSGDHRHDATVIIDESAPCSPRKPDGIKPATDNLIAQDDLRWPAHCSCGLAFAADDQWQVNELDWYEGAGHRFAWGPGSWDGPPGAMIRAPWRDDMPDNGCAAYVVFLPNGSHWCTRERSSGPAVSCGPQWTVTGIPPLITVSPSIDDRNRSRPWHGWIRDGGFVNA